MARTAVILAAGLGTRMKSALPKTLHKIAGRSMLRHLLASCEQVFDRIVVVVGPGMEAVQREAAPHPSVVQQERRGTAHAALVAAPQFGDGEVAVLYADNPLIRPDTLATPPGAPDRRGCRPRPVGIPPTRSRPVWPSNNIAMAMSSASSNGSMRRKPTRQETLCNAGVLVR